MKLATAALALHLSLASATAWAQVNAGEQKPEASLAFTMTTVSTYTFAKPDTRPELAKPVIYWVPVIAPGNLMFYRSTQTFPQWNGSGFISGLVTMTLTRILFDGHGGAKTAERWDVGHRIRDVEQDPDGSLWMLEDANPGALIHVTPR